MVLIYEHKKMLAVALGGALLVGCLTGCGTVAAFPEETPPPGATVPQAPEAPAQITIAYAENDRAATKVSYEEYMTFSTMPRPETGGMHCSPEFGGSGVLCGKCGRHSLAPCLAR